MNKYGQTAWFALLGLVAGASVACGDAPQDPQTGLLGVTSPQAQLRSAVAPTLTTVSTLTDGFEDTAYAITHTMLSEAADEAGGNGSALGFRLETIVSGTLQQDGGDETVGVSVLDEGETWLWTPAANENGTLDAFAVSVTDGESVSTTTVTVQVEVAPVNDKPVAVDLSGEVVEGSSVVIALSGSDIDDDSSVLTYQVTQPASQGLHQLSVIS